MTDATRVTCKCFLLLHIRRINLLDSVSSASTPTRIAMWMNMSLVFSFLSLLALLSQLAQQSQQTSIEIGRGRRTAKSVPKRKCKACQCCGPNGRAPSLDLRKRNAKRSYHDHMCWVMWLCIFKSARKTQEAAICACDMWFCTFFGSARRPLQNGSMCWVIWLCIFFGSVITA